MKYNRPIFIDIDDTLITLARPIRVEWSKLHGLKPHPRAEGIFLQTFADREPREYFINMKHIQYILNAWHRGKQLFFWSGNGADWAEKVCEALHIKPCASGFLTKPEYCIDDVNPNVWLKCIHVSTEFVGEGTYLNAIDVDALEGK